MRVKKCSAVGCKHGVTLSSLRREAASYPRWAVRASVLSGNPKLVMGNVRKLRELGCWELAGI